MACQLSNLDEHPLDLTLYTQLHPDGRRLIDSWLGRSVVHSQSGFGRSFEPFIFAWFATNAWGACVTGRDRDYEIINYLGRCLNQRFSELIGSDPSFSQAVEAFHKLWPIYKAQELRRNGVLASPNPNRRELIEYYEDAGSFAHEPRCFYEHVRDGESVPLDWV